MYLLLAGAVLSAGVALAGRRLTSHDPPKVQIAEPEAELAVYVSGAVRNPGVYTLVEGTRVADALTAAGGPVEDADLDRLNQAVRLRDEMQIHVPRRGEANPSATGGPAVPVSAAGGAAAAGPTASAAIHLNRASAADLESLPGIGPVTSGRILDYRAKNGPFRTVEQLRDLKLVNSSTYEKINDQGPCPCSGSRWGRPPAWAWRRCWG
jgi:competence protein ComEA